MPKRRRATKRRRTRRASSYQKCIGRELKGRKFRSRGAARSAFKAAVRKCKR